MKNQIIHKRRKIVRKRKTTCKCGCGFLPKIGNIYIHGHYAKDPNGKNKSGWHHSEESKQKLSTSCMGRVSSRKGVHLSDETKQKLRIWHIGRPLSDEHKQKIRETALKTYQNPEIRAKCGHEQVISEKHKQAVREHMLLAWKNPEFKEKLIGKNANNWKGGVSFEPYSTEFNRSLKKYIRNRDNNECQNPKCKSVTKIINIHHIDYNKMNCLEYNLITLCTSCNSRANFKRNYWERFYKKIISTKYNEKRKRRIS